MIMALKVMRNFEGPFGEMNRYARNSYAQWMWNDIMLWELLWVIFIRERSYIM